MNAAEAWLRARGIEPTARRGPDATRVVSRELTRALPPPPPIPPPAIPEPVGELADGEAALPLLEIPLDVARSILPEDDALVEALAECSTLHLPVLPDPASSTAATVDQTAPRVADISRLPTRRLPT